MLVTENEEVTQAFLQHYRGLYENTYSVPLSSTEQYYSSIQLPQMLSTQENAIFAKITATEVAEALQKMPNVEACGNDGIPSEFYKAFAKELIPFLEGLF